MLTIRSLLLSSAVTFLTACTPIKKCAYEGFGRDDWQQPERVIETLELEPGDRVADLGAGSGYFTFRLAEAVGPSGRVYAVDVDEPMLASLEERLGDANASNVETVLASADDPNIPEPPVDLIITVNTYHHIDDRVTYFRSLAGSLAPAGRLVVIDFKRAAGLWQRLLLRGHLTEPSVIEAELVEAGYRRVAAHEFLSRQSFLVFEPANVEQESVRPGINAPFLAENLDVEEWVDRFEVESREIFTQRREIANALGIRPGFAVADIGSGTGLFLSLLHERVGASGRVYATDISPTFVAHLEKRVQNENLERVEVVLGGERSVELSPASVDLAFVCDVYHHFEYPAASLSSLMEAIRPGGQLVVIDFERIPGESPEWILNHVRAGKTTFRAEIEQAGFSFLEEVAVPGLKENYFLRFERPQ